MPVATTFPISFPSDVKMGRPTAARWGVGAGCEGRGDTIAASCAGAGIGASAHATRKGPRSTVCNGRKRSCSEPPEMCLHFEDDLEATSPWLTSVVTLMRRGAFPQTPARPIAMFGERVARMVRENSDDMTLPKPKRGRARLAAMSKKSRETRLVKFAYIISNLRAIAVSPPAGWSNDRRLGYLNSCRNLVDAGRGSNAEIEHIFDEHCKSSGAGDQN